MFYHHPLIVYIYVIKSSWITHAKRVGNDQTIVVYGQASVQEMNENELGGWLKAVQA